MKNRTDTHKWLNEGTTPTLIPFFDGTAANDKSKKKATKAFTAAWNKNFDDKNICMTGKISERPHTAARSDAGYNDNEKFKLTTENGLKQENTVRFVYRPWDAQLNWPFSVLAS